MSNIQMFCKLCGKEIDLPQPGKLYCNIKCRAKAYYNKRMSKLCPQCRKNYCYVGSRRCQECLCRKSHSQVSRLFSYSNLNRKRRRRTQEF